MILLQACIAQVDWPQSAALPPVPGSASQTAAPMAEQTATYIFKHNGSQNTISTRASYFFEIQF